MNQEQYDKLYDEENFKFQSKLYSLLHANFPEHLVMGIKHSEIASFMDNGNKLRGYTKTYTSDVSRRFLMDIDGKWYEGNNSWTTKGKEVTNESLYKFINEIHRHIKMKGMK
ncbi:hypothetical protein ABDH65_11000 [Heyndrickxia ginsengihumi]|uniref:hypothetical protein n=1 Tax=Heyndrickxia ginsengihumi TaxID=363870 RepID=UPI003D22C60E